MKCLWLARAMPFPLSAGDRIYSFKLASSFAEAGASIVFVGLSASVTPDPVAGIAWQAIPGKERHQVLSLLNTLPLVAARHATRRYRRRAAELLNSSKWDVIVIDHYGSGWLADLVSRAPGCPVRVFVTHNHEASVTKSQWSNPALPLLRRGYFFQNWLKTARLERYVARISDLVTAITVSDADHFNYDAPATKTICLTPGYDGARVFDRTITCDTPRSVVLLGSFLWSAKKASLLLFLDQADPVFAQAGISIDVVGEIDIRFRNSLVARYRTVRFHGYVDDASQFLQKARMSVLAEPVGGGFKLKLLEYIFNRVPVASLRICANGLPPPVQKHMLLADDIPSLVTRVAAQIDQIDCLNAMQNATFIAADTMFVWRSRGVDLLRAINEIRFTRRLHAGDPASKAIDGVEQV